MKDVHTAHCCAKCGCKYGKDDECTVATGKAPAQYGCEFCEEELDYIKQNIPEGYAMVPVESLQRAAEWFTESQGWNWLEYEDKPLDIDEMLQCVEELKKFKAMIAAATETK